MEIRSHRELGQLVKSRRSELGMTQSDLAAAVGVSRKWVGEMESGKPTTEIGRVFTALNVLGIELSFHSASSGLASEPEELVPNIHDVLASYGSGR